MIGGMSNRESDDIYSRVVATFGSYRLIDGSCGIQWVIQKRDGRTKAGTPRWTGRSYARRRETVIRVYRSFCDAPDPEVLAILEQLPDWHSRWGVKK